MSREAVRIRISASGWRRPRLWEVRSNCRQGVDIFNKTRFTRFSQRLHIPRHSPFSRITKLYQRSWVMTDVAHSRIPIDVIVFWAGR